MSVFFLSAVVVLLLCGLLWQRAAYTRPMRALLSVLAAFRDLDFSIRARVDGAAGVTRQVLDELNQLGDTLRSQRLSELEAWALLRKVMAKADVAVLAVASDHRLRLVNEVAAQAIGANVTALLGADAAALRLTPLLEGPTPRVLREGPFGEGMWELRRSTFRLTGETHWLLVLADVSSALGQQERESWQRLIRVISHELNNSLAPIQSFAESLLDGLADTPSEEWAVDARQGLEVISRRAESLSRFIGGYTRLARLPEPDLAPLDIADLVGRTAQLERRLPVLVEGGPVAQVLGDRDQLEQLLVNLVKNAVEAAVVTAGGVRVRWTNDGSCVVLVVEDDGPGVADTANLFVPFFTTKPGGTGVGLALARQIAQAHRGTTTLRQRQDASGAQAVVRLPLMRHTT